MTFGHPIFRYDSVGSTQDVARELVERGAAPPGSVVTARAMTAGRGRQGRAWHTPPDANVCLTAIFPPVAHADAWQLAFVAGLAVAHAIVPQDARPLRFPNDVLLGGKKVAGVLIEMAGNVPLVGVGVNVRAAPLPAEIAARATSLEAFTGTEAAVPDVEARVLLSLGVCLDKWTREGFAATAEHWMRRADLAATRWFVLQGAPTLCRVVQLLPGGMVTLEAVADGGAQHSLHAAQVILGDD